MKLAGRASDLVEDGEYEAAIAVLTDLLEQDISDTDKSMMCLNLAIVHDKMGDPDRSLHWHNRGVDYERRQGGYYVAERRAEYLAEQGRDRESLAEYQDLLRHPGLTEADKDRIRKNIELLRARSG